MEIQIISQISDTLCFILFDPFIHNHESYPPVFYGDSFNKKLITLAFTSPPDQGQRGGNWGVK